MKKKTGSAYRLESLEPRLLFSADSALIPLDGGALPDDSAATLQVALIPENSSTEQSEFQSARTRELIFVDGGVKDYQLLIEDLNSPGYDEQQYAFILLDSNRDGISQISDALEQYQGVTAVHLISHGADGELQLGDILLTTDNLEQYATQIQGWQQSLTEQADFLFYSCNLAQGDAGQALLQELQELTGADIAASEDVTGSSALGGDWELEYQQGVIDTAVPISTAAQQGWTGTLATINVTTTSDVVDAGDGLTSLREAVIQANGTGAQDIIILGPGTYTLTINGMNEEAAASGDLDITRDLIIQATDATTTIIDGNGLDRVFDVLNNDLTLDGVAVTGGDVVGGGGGGGIRVGGSSIVTVNNSILSGNSTQNFGGAVNNAGTLIMDNVLISGNSSNSGGGGLYNTNIASLSNVTIDNNSANNHGGGINNTGTLTLTNVTISNNEAGASGPSGHGGGIITTGSITADHVTIAFNSAPDGGGVYATSPGDVDLSYSIISDNVQTWPSSWPPYASDGTNIIADASTINSATPATDITGTPAGLNNTLIGGPIYQTLEEQPGGLADLNPGIGAQAGVSTPAPVIDLDADDSSGSGADFQTTFYAGGGPVPIVDVDALLSDIDSPNLSELLIRITNNSDKPDEVLLYDLSGTGITDSWNANNGRLLLSGNRPISEYQTVLATLRYDNTLADPDAAPRVITFVAKDTDSNTSNTATATVYIQKTTALWLTTQGDLDPGTGVPELLQWDADQILALEYPVFEPGTSGGNLVSKFNFSGAENFDGLHFVSRSITVGGQQLQYGDLLLSSEKDATYGGLPVWEGDLFVYRPDDINNYDAGGTFFMLAENLTGDYKNLLAVSLVEQRTFIGDTWIEAGTFIYTGTDNDKNNIYHFDPSSGARSLLLDGKAPGVDIGKIQGLDLIETTTVIGGVTLQPGQILVTEDDDDTYDGEDVFYLTVSATEQSGVGNSAATHTLLFQGEDKGLESPVNTFSQEMLNAITLYSTEGVPATGTQAPTNTAPTISFIADQTIPENGSTGALAFSVADVETAAGSLTVSATSSDPVVIPNGNLTLVDLGGGNWTIEAVPAVGQYGGPVTITVTVDDGAITTERDFSITVNDLNFAPVLGAIGNQTVDELATLNIAVSATDSDLPGDNLTYSLDAASLALGMTIDANSGAFSWRPTEAQGGLTPSVTITVTDDGSGNLSDSETFAITVNEVNVNPVLDAIGNQAVDELTNLSFTATATDSDIPVNTLTFSLDATSLAAGMTIDANSGVFSWTPTEGQDGVHSVTITVTDDGSGTLTDSEAFTITVNEVNAAPVLGGIGNQTVDELTTLTFTATATDSDLPANSLTFSLDAASLALGMTIDGNSGAFSWTPTEGQGGLTPSVTITVTDDGTGTLTDSETFTITVNNTNVAPVLGTIGNQTVDELTNLSFTATATDSDLPVDNLNFSLDAASLALGMTINANTGDFSWTPTEDQDGTHSATITVTDDGTGTLVDSETFTITVNEVNSAPVGGYDTAGALQLVQSTDGSGDLTISWQATDVELDLVTLSNFKYRIVSEGTWYSPSGGDFSAALTTGWMDDSGSGYATDSDFPATTHSFIFNTKHGDVDAVRTLNGIDEDIEVRFTISDGDDYQLTSTPFNLDNEKPEPYITGGFYRFDVNRLVLQGTGFTTIAPAGTDIIDYNLDWDKLVINIDSDADTGNDITFSKSDIASVIVGTDKRLRINLTSAKEFEIETDSGFLSSNPPESLEITAGFLCDEFGNAATTDGTIISPPLAIDGTEEYTEDTDLHFSSDLSTSDLNGNNLTVTLTLSDSSAGSLSIGNEGGTIPTYDDATGVWEVTGNINNINLLLDALVFTPAENYDIDFEIDTVVDDGIASPAIGKIVMTAKPENDDPTLDNLISNQGATEDSLFSFTFAADTFSDVDSGDTLSYSATLAGGAPLPGWLSFDAGTRTFSGTPLQADVGTISIEVTADDSNGGTVIDTFDLTVDKSNDSPVGTVDLDNYSPAQGDTLNATPAFTDEDGISGPISYQWQRDGDDISGATGTTYTVTQADVGEEISVVASYVDDFGQPESLASADTAPVTNVNDRPDASGTFSMPDTDEDTISSMVRVGDIFADASITSSDIDGDTLGIAVFATSGNGTWEYSTDGVTGWTAFGSVNPNAALLLSDSSYLRYRPDGLNGETANFNFRAWDQTSGTASVNGLPSTGDTAPGTDTSFSNGGAKVEITVTPVNDAPVLGAIGDRSVDELVTLTFTATATDNDVPVDSLTYSLDASSLAAGMTIDGTSGAFSWTPTESQGGVHSVTITVTDDGTGNLTDSETFNITVNEVNVAPVLSAIGDQTVDEMTPLTFTATATDSDVPVDSLSYSLDATSLAAGMTIDANTGDFSWTPTESQGGVHSVTITVTDDGSGNLTDSETFTITVGEVNVTPVLGPIGDQTVDELTNLSFTATATDSDVPADNLTYSLDATSLAAGMTIDASTGAFSWTPSESQGGVHSVTVTVTDDGSGNLTDSETFTITVGEVNVTPVLGPIGDQTVDELTTLTVTATATDSDVPVDNLTYSLDATSLAAGMTIDASTGAFSWTPSESQGGVHSVTVTVTDDGSGNLTDSETFTITVGEVNVAPVLGAIGDQTVDEMTPLTFTATATDSDVPVDSLSFSLDATSLAAGMTIDASTGDFSWTPTESQGGVHSVTITVTDNGSGSLTDSETFTITVGEVNVTPVLGPIGDQTVDELTNLSFTATATDSDVPADNLTYSLDATSLAAGMTIDASTGAFSWTPSESQGGVHSVTVTVTDDGSGNLTDSETFTITVGEVNVAPVLGAIGDQTVDEMTPLTFTATATDSDVPVDSLSFSLDATSLAAGMTIDASTGDFSWTPTESQGGVHSVTITVTDNGSGSLTDSETFTITVGEVNVAPVLGAIGDQTVDELTTLTVTATATDSDVPANTLTYTLDAASLALGMTIDPGTGAFSWTPSEGQGGLTPSVTITVTDDGTGNLVDSETFSITVNDINHPPVLNPIGDQTAMELAALTFTATATDSDLPVDTLAFSFDAASIALGMGIDSNTGVFSWTPSAGQGGLTPSVTITVTDSGTGNLIDSETFTITVGDANTAPILGAIGDQTVDELTTLSFTATATDSDLPADTLTYSLDAASLALGMSIDANSGVISWTPTESQGGVHSVTITVTDDGTGNLTHFETFNITVNEVNVPPVLGAIGDRSIDELTNLSFTATATDSDLPANTLSYSLDATSLAAGMTIDASTGAFSWTPSESQGGVHSVTITVTDDGSGNLTDSETFTITVNEVNVAPVLGPIGNQTVDELTTLSFTATATDSDIPVDTLSYSLDATSLAAGMTIDANTGAFIWTPTESQGGVHSVTITVTDDGTGNLTDSETFNITVNEVNVPPVLGAIGNQTVDELTNLSFTATATDSDLPVDNLTFSLDATSLAAGMTIDGNTGAFSWTPTEGQGGVHSVTITVTDDGSGNLSDSETFTITVNEVNVAPVLGAIGNQTVDELTNLSFTATATDSDVPVDTLTFSLDAASLALGMTIDANSGLFNWTPTESQGGLTPSVTITVTDSGSGNLIDSETFTITVNDINISPTTSPVILTAVDEDSGARLITQAELLANAHDDDGDPLTATNLTITSGLGSLVDNGDGTWSYTPAADDDTAVSFSYLISDGTVTVAGTATLDLKPVNDAPIANDDSFTTFEDNPDGIKISLSDLLGNDSDLDGTFTYVKADKPAHGTLEYKSGTLTYTPDADFFGIDSFDYTIEDGDNAIATAAAIIAVTPVADTPQTMDVSVTVGSQSELIILDRNAVDGTEVTHFRITGISNGTLFLADGVTEVGEGDFITVAQGQAGLRFTPGTVNITDGRFNVEASLDGSSVSGEAAVVTVTVTPLSSDPDTRTDDPVEKTDDKTTDEKTDEENSEDNAAGILIKDDDLTPSLPTVDESRGPEKNFFTHLRKNRIGDEDSLQSTDALFIELPSSLDKLRIMVDKTAYSGLLQAFENLDIPSLSLDAYQQVKDTLDAIQGEMEQDSKVERMVIVSSVATSIGLSAGYVVWLLQGGSLLTSVLASMPAWQLADPLSILAGRTSDDEDDEESLEDIITEGQKKINGKSKPDAGESP